MSVLLKGYYSILEKKLEDNSRFKKRLLDENSYLVIWLFYVLTFELRTCWKC